MESKRRAFVAVCRFARCMLVTLGQLDADQKPPRTCMHCGRYVDVHTVWSRDGDETASRAMVLRGLESLLAPESLARHNREIHELASTLGFTIVEDRSVTTPQADSRPYHLVVGNNEVYARLRALLPQKEAFRKVEGTPYPTALLGRTPGIAQLRPLIHDQHPLIPPEQMDAWAQLMWRQREELSDLDADALDGLSHLWLKQARSPQDDAVADVDDFLALRGLKPKRGGYGLRGGYEPEQRQAMLHALSHIQNLWLDVPNVEILDVPRSGRRRRKTLDIQSRAFVITDRMGQLRLDGWMDVEKFIFRPGKIFGHFLFGPGRQIAQLSAYALYYDPDKHQWEKRLTRYLSWQWRIRATTANYRQPFRVTTLIENAGKGGCVASERKTGKLGANGETYRGFSISDGFKKRCIASTIKENTMT